MFKAVLVRFGKGVLAAALAGVASQAADLCGILPHFPIINYCVPLITGGILALEKALTYGGGK